MSVLSVQGALILAYYIGLTITSYIAISVAGVTWQEHDYIHVKMFNCTCLSQSEFQCYQESVSKGLSLSQIKCDVIEEPGEPTKYELCDCGSQGKSKCFHPRCYIFQNSVVVPENCSHEMCKAFDGLEMWMSAAKGGIVVGFVGAAIMSISMFCAAKRSKDSDISEFYLIHLVALIPPATITFSLMTTDVLKYKAYLGLNAWAWVMAIGFGIPLYIGWICSCQRTLAKATKYYRKKRETGNEVQL